MKVVYIFLFLIVFSSSFNFSRGQAFVKSSSDDFEWRVIGRALFDGGVFRSDSTALGNGVAIGDLRLGVIMRFLEKWEGQVELGYAESKVSLKDIYIAYRDREHSIKVGHYFEPFGIDARIATTDYRLMNMSATDAALGDRRKIGASYTYDAQRVTASAGVFSDGDVDNVKGLNEGYALVGRVVGRPVYDTEKLVHLGVSTRFSAHDKAEREKFTFKGGIPTYVLNKEQNQFIRAEVTNMVNQWRFGADLIAFYKSVYFQGEYILAHVNRSGAPNYNGQGGYVQFGYLLLGNRQYNYNRAQNWVVNPEAKNLELVFRYNVTDLNDPHARIVGGGKEQDISVGANYFFNKYVSARLNYMYVILDRNAVNGAENFDLIQARIQLRF